MNFVCKRECTYNLWYWTFDISQKKTTFWLVLHFVPPGMGFVAGVCLRWLWSMVELVGVPVERFRCWRPSVVGPHLLLCGAVRPVVVEQWRVQSAKCRQGPKCWPSLAEETPHYTQESPAFSAHLPRIVIFIKIIITIINYHYTVNHRPSPIQLLE